MYTQGYRFIIPYLQFQESKNQFKNWTISKFMENLFKGKIWTDTRPLTVFVYASHLLWIVLCCALEIVPDYRVQK